jgi:hypothetical protein
LSVNGGQSVLGVQPIAIIKGKTKWRSFNGNSEKEKQNGEQLFPIKKKQKKMAAKESKGD